MDAANGVDTDRLAEAEALLKAARLARNAVEDKASAAKVLARHFASVYETRKAQLSRAKRQVDDAERLLRDIKFGKTSKKPAERSAAPNVRGPQATAGAAGAAGRRRGLGSLAAAAARAA